MVEPVLIRSSGSTGELTFHHPEAAGSKSIDHFDVTLTLPGVSATLTVYRLEVASLSKFFGELASNWKGWEGTICWDSLEEEFKLSATRDKVGHIFLEARFRSAPGSTAEWSLCGSLVLEAGQLGALDREMKAFLGT
jgi:hypothetical protein